MRLVLLGLPGAGKGTQAKRIAEEYYLTAISTGEMLREATKEKDTFGLRVQEYMNKGELVPDEWINSLVKSRLQAKDVENGFVLDGYPRTPTASKSARSLPTKSKSEFRRCFLFRCKSGYVKTSVSATRESSFKRKTRKFPNRIKKGKNSTG